MFIYNETATTDVYTLTLPDALPNKEARKKAAGNRMIHTGRGTGSKKLKDVPEPKASRIGRAHVELQSHSDLVCRLLLEKKNLVWTLPHYVNST